MLMNISYRKDDNYIIITLYIITSAKMSYGKDADKSTKKGQ